MDLGAGIAQGTFIGGGDAHFVAAAKVVAFTGEGLEQRLVAGEVHGGHG